MKKDKPHTTYYGGIEPYEACPYSASNVKITCPESKKCGDCLVYKAVDKE